MPILYHYTSNIGLVGILSKGEIWMSDPRFLNDSQELHHAGAIVASTIRHVANEHRQKWIDAGCNPPAFDEMVANMVERFQNLSAVAPFPAAAARSTPYIFSLSQDGDSLSQWRAYGRGEYCIGFDGDQLAAAAGAHLCQVEYSDIDTVDARIVPMIEAFFTGHLVHTGPAYNGGIDTEVRASGADDLQPRLWDDYYFPRKKHPGFREEQEWRLVKPLYPRSEGTFFNDRGRYPTPCAKVKIFNTPEEIRRVVTEVVCGPGADATRAQDAFKMMKEAIGARFPLRFSRIPYRSAEYR
jgi:hypothetical protein